MSGLYVYMWTGLTVSLDLSSLVIKVKKREKTLLTNSNIIFIN